MFQYSPYFVPLVLAAVLAAASAYFGYRKQRREGSIWYVMAMCSLSGWSLFTALIVVSSPLDLKLFWFGLYATCGVYLTLTWFMLAVAYTGEGRRLTRPVVTGILLVPVPLFLITVTNHVDDIMLRNVAVVDAGGQTTLTYGYGWPYILGSAIAWIATAAATVLFFRKATRSRNVYRKLSLVLGFGGGTMLIGSVLSTLKLSPFPHMMLVPYFFLFWGVLGITFFFSRRFVRAFPIEKLVSPLSSRFEDVVHLGRDFVVEEVDSGVIMLDTEGRIVDINGTARKMIAGGDRVVGKRIHDFVDARQFLVEAEGFEEGVEGFEDGFGEFTEDDLLQDRRLQAWVDTDIGERCYDINVSEIRDDDGEVVGYTILVVDITEQKERERELQAQKKDLELQKQQLEHQNERLDRFASIVTHDLRNPLNVAEGYVDMVADMNGSTENEVQQIQHSLGRMESIIDDALMLARQGKAITETEEVELAEVARDAWGNVETGGTRLDVSVADGYRMEADRNRLLNVFENLFRNAVEHGSTGNQTSSDDAVEQGNTGKVTVGTTDHGFYVEDDGAGIPEEMRDEVLEHGYTTSEEGTGLGLSIVQDIVRAHGWNITVGEGSEGGARFDVTGVPRIGRKPL